MKAEHETKIRDLVERLSLSIAAKAVQLGKSGGIDENDYSVDEYVLAKILVTAAMEDLKDSYMPSREKHKRVVKNLRYF